MEVKTDYIRTVPLEGEHFVVQRAHYYQDQHCLVHFSLICSGEAGDMFLELDLNFDQERGRSEYRWLVELFKLEETAVYGQGSPLNSGWFVGKVFQVDSLVICPGGGNITLMTSRRTRTFRLNTPPTQYLEEVMEMRSLDSPTIKGGN